MQSILLKNITKVNNTIDGKRLNAMWLPWLWHFFDPVCKPHPNSWLHYKFSMKKLLKCFNWFFNPFSDPQVVPNIMDLIHSLLSMFYCYFRPVIKWFLRQTTRLCELQRICYGESAGAARSCGVGEFTVILVVVVVVAKVNKIDLILVMRI